MRATTAGHVTVALPNLTGIGMGWLPALGAGWRVNGIATLQSGALWSAINRSLGRFSKRFRADR